MRNYAKLFMIFLPAALMLTGCTGKGGNVTESAAIAETVSENTATGESVPKKENTESAPRADVHYMERVTAFKTSNSYGDPNMYGVKIIKSFEELESFIKKYEISDWNEHLTKFAEEVDFNKNIIAADIVALSSGGYDFDFYYTAAENGEISFEYELIENKYGMTDDEAALFMFARIPAELVNDRQDINTG